MEALLGAQPAAEPTLLGREARCYRPKRETLGSWVSMETMGHAATVPGTTLAHWMLHSNINPPLSAAGQALSQPGQPCLMDHKPLRAGLLSVLSYCAQSGAGRWVGLHGPPSIRSGDLGTAKDTESPSSLVVRQCPSARFGK